MAFVTPHTFYIIDRNGKVVAPFNKSFKTSITQPLSIFDYAHNGDFRFLITQGKHLSMYDKQLKPVKGFEFNSTKSPIAHAPKHFRIGSKDYILVAEESGKLHLLNRRGQTRIKTPGDLHFSENDWYVYHKQFTSTNADGQLVQIGQSGKLSTSNLNLDEHHGMCATANTLVTFSGN